MPTRLIRMHTHNHVCIYNQILRNQINLRGSTRDAIATAVSESLEALPQVQLDDEEETKEGDENSGESGGAEGSEGGEAAAPAAIPRDDVDVNDRVKACMVQLALEYEHKSLSIQSATCYLAISEPYMAVDVLLRGNQVSFQTSTLHPMHFYF